MNVILGNLISNAIKYSPPKTTITVNAEKDKGNVHIMVKDEDIEIKSNELELYKIFGEFYKIRKACEIVRDGTGLGLLLYKKRLNL